MGDCQNYGPFLGPYYNTGPNTGPNLGDPKRDHNFDNRPSLVLESSVWDHERVASRDSGNVCLFSLDDVVAAFVVAFVVVVALVIIHLFHRHLLAE